MRLFKHTIYFFSAFLILNFIFVLSATAQSAYDFEVMAQTGEVLGVEGTVIALGQGPSINDEGEVAFIARYTDATHGRVMLLNNGVLEEDCVIGTSASVTDEVQVNESDQVIFQMYTDNGVFSNVIRIDDNCAGPIIGSGSSSSSNPKPFDFVLPRPTLNDSGRGLFSADIDTYTMLASRMGGVGNHDVSPSLTGFPDLYPMLADNNTTVVRWGGSNTSPLLRLVDTTLGAANFIAESADFNAIGQAPGISDDGNIVAFAGDSIADGFGLFVSLFNGSDFTPIKVIGLSGDGRLDPGEQFEDINENGQFDPGEPDIGFFTNFSLQPRVGVNGEAGVYSLAYIAFDLTGNMGLYTTKVDISDPADIKVFAPELVLEIGNSISGLSGTLTNIKIYDPVNVNGEITCWVLIDTGKQAIIKASDGKNQIDRWWATINDDPLEVTWTVSLGGSTQDYELRIDFEWWHKWNIKEGNPKVYIDGGSLSSTREVVLQRPSLLAPGHAVADIGALDPGVYTLRIDGFLVPTEAVVEKVKFTLKEGLWNTRKELNALFIADYAPNDEVVDISIDGMPNSKNYSQLVELFLPILKFDDGSQPGAEGGAERYTHAYDASEIFAARESLDGPISGALDQALDLSDYAAGTPAGSAVIYGSVLKKSNIMALDSGEKDEIAINYWFHYPRSNWGEHGGFNTHEGDWEGVTVFLREELGYFEPHRVAFGQHVRVEEFFGGIEIGSIRADGGDIVLWDPAEKSGGERVFIYVGLGGHASYFRSGETDWRLKDGSVEDEFHNGQLSAIQGMTPAFLNRITDSTPLWLRFPGTWGEIIGELDEASGDDGPEGPAFISSGFGHGTRWFNPWKWERGFNKITSPADSQESGNTAIDGPVMTATSDIGDAQFLWNNVELSPYAYAAQFYLDFPQAGDGDVLEVLINDQVVGSIVGTDFTSTGELQLSEPFDISAYKDQTVSLALALRQINPVSAQVVIRDVSIVNVDLADLEPASVVYSPGVYERNEEFPITIDVNNIGTFDVPNSESFMINVILSDDDVIDETDNVLGSLTIEGPVPADLNVVVDENITVPSDFPIGIYYIGVMLDAGEQIGELEESNNIFVSNAALITIEDPLANHAPELQPVGDKIIMETELLEFSVTATDVDGDSLIMSARMANGDPVTTIGASFVDHGNGTGTFSWTPEVYAAGSYDVVFSVSDGTLPVQRLINIDVRPYSPSLRLGIEGGMFHVTFPTIADVYFRMEFSMDLQVWRQADGFPYEVLGTGEDVTLTINTSDYPRGFVRISRVDGPPSAAIHVPEMESLDVQEAYVMEDVDIPITIVDPDMDETVTIKATLPDNKPLSDIGLTFEDRGNRTGSIAGQVLEEGEYSIEVQTRDGKTIGRDQLILSVAQVPVNQPPVFDNIKPVIYNVRSRRARKVRLRASDPDGDRLTFAIERIPQKIRKHVSLDPQTGILTISLKRRYVRKRPYVLSVSVTDGAEKVTRDIKIYVKRSRFFNWFS